jgi:catechol 2,3-dioxygenase-like lactoylglutathione lyase family enzyme
MDGIVPELYCSELAASLRFYEGLGFVVRFARPEERFAYLSLGTAELMIEQPVDAGRTLLAGDMERPYGRGVNLQIAVTDVAETFRRARALGAPIHWDLEDRWYRQGETEVGQRQFVVRDPDGYLLRFAQPLGRRPETAMSSGALGSLSHMNDNSTAAPIAEVDPAFSEPDVTPPSWPEVVDVLASSEMFWLSTVRRDGRPHVTPLPAVWLDDALHFGVSEGEQKFANLQHDPRLVLTTGTNKLRSGLDVVVEGEAVRVTDDAQLERLAAVWKSKLDWDYVIVDHEFRDAAERHGWVFRITATKVLAFHKSPFSQTRFRLS